jgi:predicted pyridoxine 5'-phosphate oxidase superfamily flavin-nucleotide-binding protein
MATHKIKNEQLRRMKICLLATTAIANNTVGNCGWEYWAKGEKTAQQISDSEITIADGPINWKITRTIRLRDQQGTIQTEARGLECAINNIATTSIVVNCDNEGGRQKMKTEYEGKTYKFMLGCKRTE